LTEEAAMRLEPEREFMELAIEQAKLAYAQGDYPIGAVIVRGGEVLSAQGNRTIRDQNPVAHAEILTIVEATKKLDSRHLPEDCVLYSTHELCPMCAAAALAKVKFVVFGVSMADIREQRRKIGQGCQLSWRTIDIVCEDVFANSDQNLEVVGGFMRDECLELFRV